MIPALSGTMQGCGVRGEEASTVSPPPPPAPASLLGSAPARGRCPSPLPQVSAPAPGEGELGEGGPPEAGEVWACPGSVSGPVFLGPWPWGPVPGAASESGAAGEDAPGSGPAPPAPPAPPSPWQGRAGPGRASGLLLLSPVPPPRGACGQKERADALRDSSDQGGGEKPPPRNSSGHPGPGEPPRVQPFGRLRRSKVLSGSLLLGQKWSPAISPARAALRSAPSHRSAAPAVLTGFPAAAPVPGRCPAGGTGGLEAAVAGFSPPLLSPQGSRAEGPFPSRRGAPAGRLCFHSATRCQLRGEAARACNSLPRAQG